MKNNLKIKKVAVTAVIIGAFLLNTGTIHGQSSNQITEDTNLTLSKSAENPIKDLSVAVMDRIPVPVILVEIDQYMQNQKNRYILDVNGAYVAESYNGRTYYSRLRRGTDTHIIEKDFINLKVGDIITVRLSSGQPGDRLMDTLETYATLTVTEEMLATPSYPPLPTLSDVVNGVRLVDDKIHFNIDREIQEGDNRIIFELNGRYVAESFRGVPYNSARVISRETDTVAMRLNNQINVGDTFQINLSIGSPGRIIDVLDSMTFIVTTEGIIPLIPETYPEWDPSAYYNAGDRVMYNGQVWEALVSFQGYGDPTWAPNENSTLWRLVEDSSSPDEQQPGLYPEWNASASYTAGDRVMYDGQVWEALVTFQGNGDPTWAPNEYSTLWRLVEVI
jgi:hypothetical protein